ncbi:MAG: hypothetical protein MUF25_03475 [Pirellulaceae bacterium]|nr:hypothetical protein [Pirellulaceae bacterium]
MRSKQFVGIVILVLAGTTGCAMCDSAQDWTYSAFGGKWQRDNPHSGRVASLFDPAGGQVMEQGLPTEAEPTPPAAEEAAESAEPVVEQAEEAAEAAEPQMEEPKEAAEAAEPQIEEPKEAAAEAVPPEKADGEKTRSGAKAGSVKEPAGGTLELPVMPDESAESPKPKDDDAGLLPPLELPPQ